MTLIELSQHDHSMQNCDNLNWLVWLIRLMISNLFYNLFHKLCQFMYLSTILFVFLQLKLCFNLDFTLLFYVFTFLSIAYKLFVEILLAVYKWIEARTKLNCIFESTLVNHVLQKFPSFICFGAVRKSLSVER